MSFIEELYYGNINPSSRIFQAVINHQNKIYGYAVLSSIASNLIFQYRDMYL